MRIRKTEDILQIVPSANVQQELLSKEDAKKNKIPKPGEILRHVDKTTISYLQKGQSSNCNIVGALDDKLF